MTGKVHGLLLTLKQIIPLTDLLRLRMIHLAEVTHTIGVIALQTVEAECTRVGLCSCGGRVLAGQTQGVDDLAPLFEPRLVLLEDRSQLLLLTDAVAVD